MTTREKGGNEMGRDGMGGGRSGGCNKWLTFDSQRELPHNLATRIPASHF